MCPDTYPLQLPLLPFASHVQLHQKPSAPCATVHNDTYDEKTSTHLLLLLFNCPDYQTHPIPLGFHPVFAMLHHDRNCKSLWVFLLTTSVPLQSSFANIPMPKNKPPPKSSKLANGCYRTRSQHVLMRPVTRLAHPMKAINTLAISNKWTKITTNNMIFN